MDALRDPINTLARRILFLVPIALLVVLFVQAVKLVGCLLDPLAKLAPMETVVGMAVVDLLAVVTIVGLCFLAGILARTAVVGAFGDRLERAVLRRIPADSSEARRAHR